MSPSSPNSSFTSSEMGLATSSPRPDLLNSQDNLTSHPQSQRADSSSRSTRKIITLSKRHDRSKEELSRQPANAASPAEAEVPSLSSSSHSNAAASSARASPLTSMPQREEEGTTYTSASSGPSTPRIIMKPKKPSPLAAVLPRLIAAIIKRDDYAFFTQPVDEREVPGYSSVIQNPMDLGTMKAKVDQGQYATLDQFKDDFGLVTSNAKAFNPPDSIFHQQAAKIELWGRKAIAKEEEKGVILPLDETNSAPEPEVSHSPLPTSSKKLSIRLKRPPTAESQSQPSPSNVKRSRPSAKGKERSASRPAVSSALRQPPTLADSPSSSYDNGVDQEGWNTSSRASMTREAKVDLSNAQDTAMTDPRVKVEAEDELRGYESGDMQTNEDRDEDSGHDDEESDGSDDDDGDEEDEDEDEDEEEDEKADISTERDGSASLAASQRESATPGPGGASRRRPPVASRKYLPRKNAPAQPDQSPMAAIQRVLKEGERLGIALDINEAALYARQASRDQFSEKMLPYCPDGSVDIDTLRYQERVDLFASRGLNVDPSSNGPVSGYSPPELSALHPLHPDTQQYSAQLTRVARKDTLFAVNSALPSIIEDRASHHETALPAGYSRLPVTLPTAPVVTKRHHGLLSEGESHLPNRWPHPQQTCLKDYTVPDVLDPRALPSARPDPSSIQLKTLGGGPTTQKSRNKDAEREADGVSNLLDWTYSHAYYHRMWDGITDLAVWKDVDSTVMRFGPNGGIRERDGELSSFQKWEETKCRRMKEMIKWEEREAICRAAGSAPAETNVFPPLVDDETEMGLLSKISAMSDEYRALPNSEKARQHLESLDFYRMILWGSKPDGVASTSGVNGDAWARSVEAFVEGAVQLASQSEVPEDTSINEPLDVKASTATLATTQSSHDLDDQKAQEEASGDLFRSPSPPLSAPPSVSVPLPLTRAERELEALSQGIVLPAPLYDYVRDKIVVPASNSGGTAVVAKAGFWMKRLHDLSSKSGEDAGNEQVAEEWGMDLLAPDDPLWKELANVVSSPSVQPQEPSSPEMLMKLTSSDFSYLFISTPRLWGRSHFTRILLDKPILMDSLILRKMDEWSEVAQGRGRSDAAPAVENGTVSSEGIEELIRYGDAQWTRTRMAQALAQYARLLLTLDDAKKKRRRSGGAKHDSMEGGKKTEEWEQMSKLEEEIRLALLSMARMAPGFHVKMPTI